jgi:16S rRNA (uracil1498-N3)-methyltransferase
VNLILITADERDERGEVVLADRRAEHLRSVLKIRPGQSLRIGQINGATGTGMVKAVDEHRVVLRCVFSGPPAQRPPVDLLLALPRPKVMKRLWAPLAALGVGRIILTNAQRVERYYFDSHVLDPAFYNAQLQTGLEQAMDTWLPAVSVHRQFKPLVEEELAGLVPDALRLVGDPAGPTRIAAELQATPQPRILLGVGPEGGWSDYELDLLQAHGFRRVGMGPRTLRTDTACIALIALCLDALP